MLDMSIEVRVIFLDQYVNKRAWFSTLADMQAILAKTIVCSVWLCVLMSPIEK